MTTTDEEAAKGRARIESALRQNSCLTSQQLVEVRGDETITHILEMGSPKYTTRTQVSGSTTGFTQVFVPRLEDLLDLVPKHLLSQQWIKTDAWCRNLRLEEDLPHAEARELLDHCPAPGLYTNGDVSVLCIDMGDALHIRQPSADYTGLLQKGLAMLASEHASIPNSGEIADPVFNANQREELAISQCSYRFHVSAAKELWAGYIKGKEDQMSQVKQILVPPVDHMADLVAQEDARFAEHHVDHMAEIMAQEDARFAEHVADAIHSLKASQEARIRQALLDLADNASYQFSLTWGERASSGTAFLQRGVLPESYTLVLTDHATFEVQSVQFETIAETLHALREGSTPIAHPGLLSLQRAVHAGAEEFVPVRQRLEPSEFENAKVSAVAAATRKLAKGVYWNGDLWLEVCERYLLIGQGAEAHLRIDLDLASKGLAGASPLCVEVNQALLNAWRILLRTPVVLNWTANPGLRSAPSLIEEQELCLHQVLRFLMRKATEFDTLTLDGEVFHFRRYGSCIEVFRVERSGYVRKDVYRVVEEEPYFIHTVSYNDACAPLDRPAQLPSEENFSLTRYTDLTEAAVSHEKYPAETLWLLRHRHQLDDMLRLGLLEKTLTDRLALDRECIINRTGHTAWWSEAPGLARLNRLKEELKDKLMEEEKEQKIAEAIEGLKQKLHKEANTSSQQLTEARDGLEITHVLETCPRRYTTHTRREGVTLGFTQAVFHSYAELLDAVPRHLFLGEWTLVKDWCRDMGLGREDLPHKECRRFLDRALQPGLYTNGEITVLCTAPVPAQRLIRVFNDKDKASLQHGAHWYLSMSARSHELLAQGLEMLSSEHVMSADVCSEDMVREKATKLWQALEKSAQGRVAAARAKLVERRQELSTSITLRTTYTDAEGVSTEYIVEEAPDCLFTRSFKGAETLSWTQTYVATGYEELIAKIPDHVVLQEWSEGGCPPHSGWYGDPTKVREVEILRQLFNLRASLPLGHVFTNGKATLVGPRSPDCWSVPHTFVLYEDGFAVTSSCTSEGLAAVLELFQGEHVSTPLIPNQPFISVAEEAWSRHLEEKQVTEHKAEVAKARDRLVRRLQGLVATTALRCTDTGEDGVSTDYILEQSPNTLTTRRYKGTETLGWTQLHDEELTPLAAQIPDRLVLREWIASSCPPFCSWYNDPTKAHELEIARQLFNLRPTLPLDRVFTNGKVTIVGPETGVTGWTPISGLQLTPLGLRVSGSGIDLQDLEGVLAMFQGEHVNIPRPGNSALCAQEAEQAWDKHVKEKQMSTDNQYPHRHLFDAAAQQLEVGDRARVHGSSNDGLIWRESENVTVLYLRTDTVDGLRVAALLVTFDKTTGEFKERVYLNPREGQGYDDRRHRVMRGESCHTLRGEDFKSRLIPFLRQVLGNPSAEEVLGRDLSKLAFLHPEASDLGSGVGYLRKQAARVHFGSDEKARFIKLQRLNTKEQVCTVTLTWEDEVPFCRVTSSGEAAWDSELLKSALDELEQTGIAEEDGLSPAGKRHLRLKGWGRAPASDDEVRQELLNRATDLSAETRTEMERAFTQLLRSLRGRHIGRLCNYTFRYVDRELEVFDERRHVDSDSLSSRQKTFSLVDGVRADLIRALSLGPLTEEGIKRSLGIEENGASNFWSTDADVSAPALFAKFFPDRITRETPPTTTPTPTPSVVTERGKRWDLQDMLPRLKALNEASPSHTQFRGAQGTYVLLKDSTTIAAVYLPDNGQIEVCYPNKHALFWANREDSELRALEPREQLHTPEFWASFKQFLDQAPPGRLQRSGPNERRLAEIQMSGGQAKYLVPSGEVRVVVELRQRVGATQLTAWQGPLSGTWACSPLGVCWYQGDGDLSLGPSLSPLLDGYVARRGGAETLLDFAVRMRKVRPLQEVNAHTWTSGNGSTLSYTAMDGQCLAVLAHPDRPPEFIAFIGEGTYSVGDSTSPIRADTFTKYHRRELSASERAGLEALRGENRRRLTTQQPLANPHVETWGVMKSLRDLSSGMTGPLTGCGIFKMRDGTEAPLNFSLNATDDGRCLRLQTTQGEMALEYLYDLGLTFFRGVDLGVDFADLASAILNPKPEEKPAQEPEAEIASVEGATMNSDNTNSPKQAPATGEAKPDAKPSVIDRAKAKVGEIRDQAKDEASDASWRLATKQMVKLVREPLVAFLCRQTGQATDSDFGKKVGEFLGTEAGDALVAGILAVGLTSLPGNDPRVQRLAREMRVRSMSEVGDMVVDVLMGPLRQVLAQYLSDSGESASPLQLPAASPSASDVLEQAHLDNPLVASMNGHASAGPKN